MDSFLETLESQSDLHLEQLEVGYGEHGLSFSANLECEAPPLASLFGSLGLEVPNNGTGLKPTKVSISLGYEHSRNNTIASAYSTVAKITMTGPIQLGDLFPVANFPTSIVPAIDKIELSFELDKSISDPGGTPTTKVTGKSIGIDFQLCFSTSGSTTPNILAGTYQKYEQNGTKISGIAGTLHSASNGWMDLGIGQGFPLDISIQNPFVVHGNHAKTTTSDDKSDSFTLVGAGINMSGKPSFPNVPVVHQFLKQAEFHFNGVNLVYANSAMTPPNVIIANELLSKVGLAALEASPFTMGVIGVPSTAISKGINIKAAASTGDTFDISQWITSWPTGYVPTSELADIAKIFPPFKITEIDFEYHQGSKGMLLGAKAVIDVSKQLSANPIPFDLSASCQQGNDGKSAWVVMGGSSFTQPMTFVSIIDSVLSTFDIKDSVPSSISALDLSIKKLSFSYNTSIHDFEFSFTLDKPAPFSGITGGDIKTASASSHSFSTFRLSRIKTAKASLTQMSISIDAGLQLEELLDLQGDLPVALNPTLDTVEFMLTLASTNADGAAIHSDDFSFSTTFTDEGHLFEFTGAYSKVTSGSTTSKLFGGTMHSPTGGSIDMGENFPINIKLKDLFLAKVSVSEGTNKTSFSVFGSDLTVGVDINLETLPVVGHFLSEAKFKFNDLSFTYSKTKISTKELLIVNNFLNEIGVTSLLTDQSSANNQNGNKATFPAGYSLQGSLILGDNTMTIPLHTSFAPSADADKGGGVAQASPGKSPTTASPVGKKFGPVTIDSVGLGLRDGGIGLKFTGGLAIGPVALELIGFEITSPITHFDPDITIEGLGLDINKGALHLQGLMMEGSIEMPEMNYNTGQVTKVKLKDYSGALSIQYKKYNLDAIGSYAQLPDGSPTMFLYAFLGTPLGGPPVFFVTGIAAGFGYNRTFNLPPPTAISSFPLIEPVMGQPPTASLAEEFTSMNHDFLPKEGAFWGAIGVRGESFKMVESFVLLDVLFNESIEIDLIGISNMTFPTPKEGDTTHPLAKIIIGIEARILPDQGVLIVDGAFQPGTYILSPKTHITGGFGMISFFADQTTGSYKGAREGEFIFSIGGYPNTYKTPSYYPHPQRIQINWPINKIHTIKGSAYFAIGPEAMMAGGSFENLYHIGGPLDISASFILGADFIIYWKPYHYNADVSLEIDVCAHINIDLWLFSIHLNFNMDLGADLQVWGPPFAGKGVLTVHAVVTFSVDVSFGDTNPTPVPIAWSEFSTSFLPATDKLLNAAVGSGLLAKVEHTVNKITATIDVVNPKEMSVVCHAATPLKTVTTSTNVAVSGTPSTDFGVAPMAKTSDDIKSSLTVTVTKDAENSTKTNVEGDFEYRILTRNLPSAMWQAAETEGDIPDTKGKGLITDLACGIEITPNPPTVEAPFVITEPEEEIIMMPHAEGATAFTYDASNFTMTA